MLTLSKNGVAIVLFILSVVGLEASESEVQAFIAGVGHVVAFGLMIYNQWQRRDVKGFLWKTPERD
jgi:hypothetical protein